MRKIIKKSFIFKFVIIPVVVTAVVCTANYGYFRWRFMRITNIPMVYFDRKPCAVNIPVRYIDRQRTNWEGVPIRSQNRWTYSFRKGKSSDEACITISRWGLGGFTVYTARYEITDSAVKKKLFEL